MKRIKVAVLCGGPSNEWEVSIRSGAQIAKNLPSEKYDAKIVQIAPDGRWLLLDRKKAVALKVFGENGRAAASDLRKFDLAFVALHGKFGEDGTVQAILETIGLPYTGSGILSSALGMDKLRTGEILRSVGITVPRTIAVGRKDLASAARTVSSTIGYPCVVKPNRSGSSVGVTMVGSAKELRPAILKALEEDSLALVQERVTGRELTCGVLGITGGRVLPLPPVEIISHAEFFDYESKYNSKATEEICPAPLTVAETRKLQELARKAHEAIDARGLTRSDFILSKGKFYFLEINTSPGMTAQSLCPKEAAALGLSFGEFLDKIAILALPEQGQARPRARR